MKERWQQVTESLVIRTTRFRSVGVQDLINSLASGLPAHGAQSPLQETVCTESTVCAGPGVGEEVAKAEHTKQPAKELRDAEATTSTSTSSRKDSSSTSSPVSSPHPWRADGRAPLLPQIAILRRQSDVKRPGWVSVIHDKSEGRI